ncbi:unnamed protein product [Paramecium pentaurelia]|uniref:EGF-like domain-containing protein n=1 Tax=Paramecium pentaurelia TaxID=43138 RepID=A0A8S1Y0Z5_9CILI|nr:unnamed protein product [Paramecium pentaurelia]
MVHGHLKLLILRQAHFHTSPTNYQMTSGFCDDLPYEIRTVNFIMEMPNPISGYLSFTSSNTNDGQVSIRNIFVSVPKCYPSCQQCTGPKFNQCKSCYYGLPTNNSCPPCPSNQYYNKEFGCRDICFIDNPYYYNGFCQSYPINIIAQGPLGMQKYHWFNIYDPLHVDTSPNFIYTNDYGIFKFNSGIYRFYNSLSTQAIYGIGFYIRFHIEFWCIYQSNYLLIQQPYNNTYFGSMYRNESGIQTHNIKIYSTSSYPLYLNYTSNSRYYIIAYIDIPKFRFLFSVIGNYTDETAGWGLSYVQITSGFCPKYCQLCEVPFKCNTCANGYYRYKNNTCIGSCSQKYQNLQGSYCYDFDDETPYSQYLVYDFIGLVQDPEQYTQYKLIYKNATNLLKGSDIYQQILNRPQLQQRIFGGPLIWAQAKFQRIYNVDDPHHGITIAFYILYGPEFPSDGLFIYTVENNEPVSKSTKSYNGSYSNGEKYTRVYERINHNTNTLTISWECFGPNNEPIKAYCGFYNYYLAVHKCQPYCLQCLNETTCTQWSSDYDANVVKFSQEECLINQYYDNDSYSCLDCQLPCLTCTSKITCQTCQSTYTQTKLGWVCKLNQYEDSNQCFDCPIECNQCLNSSICIECLVTNNRQLKNKQCICIDGYYPISQNPQCQRCHQFCKTCTGPTQNDCLICNNIVNIQIFGTICRCPIGQFLKATANSCSQCHLSCQTCLQETIDGCLTCDSSLNRILKGKKCACAPGFYELNSLCTNCPDTEDAFLSQCYKLCINNEQLWHTNTCNTCDSGFDLISGECQPICGDLQIKGYEQCEDNNTNIDDLCYNCQFQCPSHCLTCDEQTTLPCPDICGDGIITGNEECEDGNTIQYDGCFNCRYQCQLPCTKCIKGQCFECNTGGWDINLTNQPWICTERCGDHLVVGEEQCDDGNQIDTDGCKNCKHFCRIGCSSCNYTTKTCLSCELPGFVPESYYCKNICGDQLVVKDSYGFYKEECDYGNSNNYDGCNNYCRFQCQIESVCKSCVNNRCEQCAPEYWLSDNKICIPICGDSIKGNNVRLNSYNPIRVVQIAKRYVNPLVLLAIILDLVVNFVRMVMKELIIYVNQFVETEEQHKMKNVMMGILFLEMVVINALLVALLLVQFVIRVFVKIVLKGMSQLIIPVFKFMITNLIQDY